MKALLGTLVFSILVPGAFVVAIPVALGMASRSPGFVGSRTAGLFLILVGAAIYTWAATAFVREGKGTPSPTAPPTHFVAVGPYRYVRNPIYIGELIVVAGLAA
ncbi:MAG: isoprenylcysteine carboxyl methyltransferase, partial [Chloroflexi bacterium]|nr:isoprenylcysteine carboxyl methyltransferase [Chloroflexota bacterium]